jgi:hypothetical protein
VSIASLDARGDLRCLGRALRGALRRSMARRPLLYYSLNYWRPLVRQLRVRHDTDLVIEGFPRSGNTFAQVAFEMAQPRPVNLAHHLHVPAQLIRAERLGIPRIVLLRMPVDAVVSLLIRHPSTPVGDALKTYAWFYRTVDAKLTSYVLAPFETVTTDLGGIVDQVNDRFGTSFVRFEHNQELLDAVFEEIDRVNRVRGSGLESQVARPSGARGGLQAYYRNIVMSRRYLPLLAVAQEVYRALMTQVEA